ncbi:MAG: hypothetical protein KF805_08440 [Phycisphaeraceae bacterium]|nr:hypothetical protein [Phycisphaeraceae bacterium]
MGLEGVAQFEADCKREAREVARRADVAHRKLTLEVLTRVVKKTPVDRGRARGNWMVTVGSPADGESGFIAGDGASGSAEAQATQFALNAGTAIVRGVSPFSDIFITNNLPYIEVLEFGQFVPPNPGPSKDRRRGRKGRVLVQDGFSVQAPQGMLGVTLAEIEVWWAANIEGFARGLGLEVTNA